MYQKIKKLLFHTLIPAVLAVLMIPTMAFAEAVSCTAAIPVEVTVTGSRLPSDVQYKLVLEAVTPGAPMPDVTELIIKDGGKASFGPMTYTLPEDYQYRIYQNSEVKNYFTYDATIYTVMVRVVNTDDGKLTAEIWAVNDGSAEQKVDGIVFANSYKKSSGGGSSGGGGGNPSGGGSPSGGPGVIVDELTVIEDSQTPLADVIPSGILPKTGDTTNLAFWLLLMSVSGGALALLMVLKKRMD